jgi:hypothetical protein
MRALAASTNAAGLPTRFMSLGAVGHEFPSDMASRMCVAIAWARGSDPESCGIARAGAAATGFEQLR